MDVNSLGNTNLSNRQNNDAALNRTHDTEGSKGSGTSFQKVANTPSSALVSFPVEVKEAVQKSDIVQTNETGASQTREKESGSQVDLTI